MIDHTRYDQKMRAMIILNLKPTLLELDYGEYFSNNFQITEYIILYKKALSRHFIKLYLDR